MYEVLELSPERGGGSATQSKIPQQVGVHAPSLNGAKSLHFLIHLEMANNHRNGLMETLAETLAAGGHQVTISCEPKIAFQFSDEGKVEVHDNRHRINAKFGGLKPYSLRLIDTYCGNSVSDLSTANQKRYGLFKNLMRSCVPDVVILWSGNFRYQEGTKAALADAGLGVRVLFAEVGWFPQGEFVYLDEKGVNAFRELLINSSGAGDRRLFGV